MFIICMRSSNPETETRKNETKRNEIIITFRQRKACNILSNYALYATSALGRILNTHPTERAARRDGLTIYQHQMETKQREGYFQKDSRRQDRKVGGGVPVSQDTKQQ